jgi:hypothetical protein
MCDSVRLSSSGDVCERANRQDGHDVAFEELEGRVVLGAVIEDLVAIQLKGPVNVSVS